MLGHKVGGRGRKNGATLLASKRRLLCKIWGLETDRKRAEAYVNHYRDLHTTKDIPSTDLDFTDSTDYIELVEILKQHGKPPNQGTQSPELSSVVAALRSHPHRWLLTPRSDEAVQAAIRAGLELWLFTDPPLDDLRLTLESANKNYISTKLQPSITRAIMDRRLSPDFSAKTLTRKGGFYLVFTHSLLDHLTFASKKHIRIFQHASVLRQYQHNSLERSMYPDGLLEETYRTLSLLFPCGEYFSSQRVRKIVRREQVDIEAHIERQMNEDEQFHLSSYPFYAKRLEKIQARYDEVKPSTLKQWWYDRRRRDEWAALMVALVVFVLTVIFGTISAVTGIMQVYASFRFR